MFAPSSVRDVSAGSLTEADGAAGMIPARSFDPSVFCLPFALPTVGLARAQRESEFLPSPIYLPSAPAATASAIKWRLVAADEQQLLVEEPERLTDMGIAGGAGSGSSLSSRARIVPNSKYNEGVSGNRASEASNNNATATAPPMLRSLSQEVARASLRQQCDEVTLLRDAAILDGAPGWQHQRGGCG